MKNGEKKKYPGCLSRRKLVSTPEFDRQVSSGDIFAEYAQLFKDPGMILFGKFNVQI